MNINEVIYCCNSGADTVNCSAGDSYNIEALRIFDKKYIPMEQLEKLLINRELSYTYSCLGLPGILPELFSFRQSIVERIHFLMFKVVKIDREQIVINVSEKINLKKDGVIDTFCKCKSLAKIRFVKQSNMSLNNCKGNAAIIVFDIDNIDENLFCADIEKESGIANLKRYALCIGLSLFVEMDGDWDKIISDAEKKMMSSSEKLRAVQKEVSELQVDNQRKEETIKDLNLRLKSYQDELLNTRKWAYDVLHLHDIEEDHLDVKNEKDWELFMSRVLEIGEQMKEQAAKIDKSSKLKGIKKSFSKKYRKFDESDLSFLSTGEYLLELHKDEDIDFSPVLISFSKCLEGVLSRLLLERQVITKDDPAMLGNLLTYVRRYSELLDLYSYQFKLITNNLKEFIKYRNMAAHKEGIKYETVVKAKKLLYDFEMQNTELLLDLINSKY